MSGQPVSNKSSANAPDSASKSKTPPIKNVPYLSDVRLLPRVRKYLEDESSSNPLDIGSVVTYLQQKYPEYRRKKRLTFTHSVRKAYDIVADELEDSLSDEDVDILSSKRPKRPKHSHEKSSVGAANTSDLSFSDDGGYAEYLDSNVVNKTVTNMYLSPAPVINAHQRSSAAQDVGEKKSTGFLRCRSDPSINKDFELEGLGYLDRGPRTPLNTSKLVESLPASPRVPAATVDRSDDPGTEITPSVKPKPVIITIGDEEERDVIETPKDSQTSTPAAKSGQKSVMSHKKKRKSTGAKAKDENATNPPVVPKKKGAIDATYSTTKFSQIGGNIKTIEEVQKLLLHMRYPNIYQQIGVTPPRGFLLHGPPGCGKTLMAHAIAGELELPFFKLAATELVSGVSGESEERVRNLFAQATAHAPCILFIDEVDSITPKRETASKDMERRIVSQFLTCLDALCEKKDAHVLVIGATNRPDSLDPALRRAGRFDREISMGIPDIKARESILRVLCKDIRLSSDFDYSSISQLTPGYVGADLSSLVREAAMLAVNRIFASLEKVLVKEKPSSSVPADATQPSAEGVNLTSQSQQGTEAMVESQQTGGDNNQSAVVEPLKRVTADQEKTTSTSGETDASLWKNLPSLSDEMLSSLHIDMDDFLNAVQIVQPSAKREGFATVPGVTWDDVGALKAIREELQMAILAPVKYPEQFSSLGLTSPSGVLLAGPPGCGKTLLAKAIANESGVNFISVKGPELINMYVGESEKAVRQVFQRARNSSPCVVFFDELDSLCPRRSLSGSDGGSGSRIVNQLLTEMDGLQERKQVFIMGATNRPDIIDPAILRPGRLDKTLYVGLPTVEDRTDILRTVTKNCTKPYIEGVDLAEIAALPICDGFSGADLTAVVREASMAAMKEYISEETGAAGGQSKHPPRIILRRQHFDTALTNIKPSISAKDRALYKAMSGG